MIRQSYTDNKKEKTKKYNLQGKSSRSIRWFDLDHEWLEENFRTIEPDLYKNFIKQILGVKRQTNIHYLYHQMVTIKNKT